MFKTVIFDRCTVVADNDVDLGPILSLADTEVLFQGMSLSRVPKMQTPSSATRRSSTAR